MSGQSLAHRHATERIHFIHVYRCTFKKAFSIQGTYESIFASCARIAVITFCTAMGTGHALPIQHIRTIHTVKTCPISFITESTCTELCTPFLAGFTVKPSMTCGTRCQGTADSACVRTLETSWGIFIRVIPIWASICTVAILLMTCSCTPTFACVFAYLSVKTNLAQGALGKVCTPLTVAWTWFTDAFRKVKLFEASFDLERDHLYNTSCYDEQGTHTTHGE